MTSAYLELAFRVLCMHSPRHNNYTYSQVLCRYNKNCPYFPLIGMLYNKKITQLVTNNMWGNKKNTY